MVDVVADKENIQEKSVEFFKNFDVVCLNDYPADVQVGILYIGNDFLFLRYFLWDTHLYVKILLIYTASYNIKKNTTWSDECEMWKQQRVIRLLRCISDKLFLFCFLLLFYFTKMLIKKIILHNLFVEVITYSALSNCRTINFIGDLQL